jgi:hypothetical protein
MIGPTLDEMRDTPSAKLAHHAALVWLCHGFVA